MMEISETVPLNAPHMISTSDPEATALFQRPELKALQVSSAAMFPLYPEYPLVLPMRMFAPEMAPPPLPWANADRMVQANGALQIDTEELIAGAKTVPPRLNAPIVPLYPE